MPGARDFDRGLSARGLRHMQQLSAWARDTISPPDSVLCSPAVRTRESLAPIIRTWPELAQVTRYVPEIYDAATGTLQTLVESAFDSVNSLLLVGHNPGLETLLALVLRDEDAARARKMPPGTLAAVRFDNGWRDNSRNGILSHLVKRKNLSYA